MYCLRRRATAGMARLRVFCTYSTVYGEAGAIPRDRGMVVVHTAISRRVHFQMNANTCHPLPSLRRRFPPDRSLYHATQLVDAKQRVLYDLGASTTGDRAFWVETLTKASRFSMGSGDEQRQGALSKRFLVTTRAGNRGGIAGGPGGGRRGWSERGEGTGPSTRYNMDGHCACRT